MRWVKALCLSVVVTVAAACGSAFAAEPIRVGVALSQTGNLADSAEHIRKAIVLWQELANKSGGISGRTVELVTYDDRSDPATAVKLTERLITSDNVDVLIAPFGSAATAAASAASERYKRVMINVAGSAEQIHRRGFKYIFQVVPPAADYVAGVFPLAQAHGLKSIAFVSRDYVASRNAEPTVKSLAEKHGLKVEMVEYYPAGTLDFSSVISQMRRSRPDVWLSIAYQNETIEVVKQLKAGNYAPAMYVSNGTSQEDFIKATGKDGEYIFGISNYEPHLKTKDNEAFVQAYRAKWNTDPGYYAAMGWASMEIIKAAVTKAGGTDQDKMRDAILSLKIETPFGPFEVDSTGAQVGKKAMIVQVQNGRREIVWPFDLKTAPAVLPMPDWSGRK